MAEPFASADGLVTVQRPEGEAWECLQSRQKQDGSTVTTVKCWRTVEGEFFFLTAKDYALEKPESRSAETLATQVHKQSYQQLYNGVKYLSSAAVSHRGHRAWDVKFDAQHERLGRIRKVERVIVHETHVLLLGAEGSRDVFDRLQQPVDAWFATAMFGSLPPQVPPPP